MQQQDDPAVTTRAQQGLARTTKLWNAAENDRIGLYNDPVSSVIAHYQNAADDQSLPEGRTFGIGSKPETGIYKAARTQKLFIVPQANVLSGAGQEQKSAAGTENVDAEKEAEQAGAAKLAERAAAANAAADFAKTAAAEQTSSKKARTQQLWNAAANDKALAMERPPKWSASRVNAAIATWQAGADDQQSKAGIFKSKDALTQKLFIVPQANVLTGQGQEETTAAGTEDVAAEKVKEAKGAARIVSKAAKTAALDKKKRAAKAQTLDAAPYMRPMPAPFGKEAAPLQVGHPQPYDRGEVRPMGTKQVASGAGGAAEFGQSGMSLSELRAMEAKSAEGQQRASAGDEGKGAPHAERQSATQALWNAAAESAESRAAKAAHAVATGVALEGAYRGYRASRQRSYLPADYHAAGAQYRGEARRQALWNAASDGGAESSFFKPKPKARYGVPLKGAYRGYDASQQVSYLPPNFHGQADKARTQQLWDAAENDDSLESTRQKLGMAPRAARGKASADLSGAPRDYLAGMDYHAPNYLAGQGW